jgi:hypothetical protein
MRTNEVADISHGTSRSINRINLTASLDRDCYFRSRGRVSHPANSVSHIEAISILNPNYATDTLVVSSMNIPSNFYLIES